eukprot:sb/3477813/
MAIRHHTHSQRRLFWVAFPALKTANFREPNRKNARFDPILLDGPFTGSSQLKLLTSDNWLAARRGSRKIAREKRGRDVPKTTGAIELDSTTQRLMSGEHMHFYIL